MLSDSQSTEVDQLVGTWTGSWGQATRQWEITIRFKVNESQALVGKVLHYTGVAYSECTGAKIKARKKTFDTYEIEMKSGPNLCNVRGELRLTDNELKG